MIYRWRERRSGKTTAIFEEIAWLDIMDMIPPSNNIIIIFPDEKMLWRAAENHAYKFSEELKRKIIYETPINSQGYMLHRVFRIYIDEVQYIDPMFIRKIQDYFDERIIAYGSKLDRSTAQFINLDFII